MIDQSLLYMACLNPVGMSRAGVVESVRSKGKRWEQRRVCFSVCNSSRGVIVLLNDEFQRVLVG